MYIEHDVYNAYIEYNVYIMCNVLIVHNVYSVYLVYGARIVYTVHKNIQCEVCMHCIQCDVSSLYISDIAAFTTQVQSKVHAKILGQIDPK